MTKYEVQLFFDFEKSCHKEMRGGQTMYDVRGCHKWLTIGELFDYWLKS